MNDKLWNPGTENTFHQEIAEAEKLLPIGLIRQMMTPDDGQSFEVSLSKGATITIDMVMRVTEAPCGDVWLFCRESNFLRRHGEKQRLVNINTSHVSSIKRLYWR